MWSDINIVSRWDQVCAIESLGKNLCGPLLIKDWPLAAQMKVKCVEVILAYLKRLIFSYKFEKLEKYVYQIHVNQYKIDHCNWKLHKLYYYSYKQMDNDAIWIEIRIVFYKWFNIMTNQNAIVVVVVIILTGKQLDGFINSLYEH